MSLKREDDDNRLYWLLSLVQSWLVSVCYLVAAFVLKPVLQPFDPPPALMVFAALLAASLVGTGFGLVLQYSLGVPHRCRPALIHTPFQRRVAHARYWSGKTALQTHIFAALQSGVSYAGMMVAFGHLYGWFLPDAGRTISSALPIIIIALGTLAVTLFHAHRLRRLSGHSMPVVA